MGVKGGASWKKREKRLLSGPKIETFKALLRKVNERILVSSLESDISRGNVEENTFPENTKVYRRAFSRMPVKIPRTA